MQQKQEMTPIYNRTLHDMQEDTWRRAVGDDFPLTLNGAIVLVLLIAWWFAYRFLKGIGDDMRKAQEKKEAKEKRDQAVQIEAMRLERERLRSQRNEGTKRKPKIEVIEEDEP